MIHLIRANHANMFELQNYIGLDVNVITSLHPLTHITLHHTKLWSPTDLPLFPFRRQILNRLIGGEQWLLGLERIITTHSDESIHRNILHTAETYTPYTHQAVELRKAGIITKLICTCWETVPHANEKFRILRKWKSDAYKYVDIFHTPTLRAKQALIAEGVSPAKIVVIPYGVDLTVFHPNLPGVSRKAHKPIVLTVARMVPEKGLEIYKKVAEQLSDIADFRWVFASSYADMPAIYRSADIFFLPSQTTDTWEEQYGMALVEAMATGLSIVTTVSGAIPEVVGDAGIVLGENDLDKMVKSLKQLITNPDIYKKYSKLSLARAKKYFDTRKVSRQLAKLYI
ncbi:MAG: glycosyltransferase family 4 protein [Microgenomates group bacterium]